MDIGEEDAHDGLETISVLNVISTRENVLIQQPIAYILRARVHGLQGVFMPKIREVW